MIPPGTTWSSREGSEGGGAGWRQEWEQAGCEDLSTSASFFPFTHLQLWRRAMLLSRPSPIVRSIIGPRFSTCPPPLLSPQTSPRIFGSACFSIAVLPTFDSAGKEGAAEQRGTKHDRSHACDPCPFLGSDKEVDLGASPAV